MKGNANSGHSALFSLAWHTLGHQSTTFFMVGGPHINVLSLVTRIQASLGPEIRLHTTSYTSVYLSVAFSSVLVKSLTRLQSACSSKLIFQERLDYMLMCSGPSGQQKKRRHWKSQTMLCFMCHSPDLPHHMTQVQRLRAEHQLFLLSMSWIGMWILKNLMILDPWWSHYRFLYDFFGTFQ